MHAALGRPAPRRTIRASFGAIAVLASILGSACAGGYHYVGSATLRNVFRVPSGWTSYGKTDLLKAAGIADDPAAVGRYKFLIGYDADPSQASILHVLDLSRSTAYPVILTWVQVLGEGNRDQFSLSAIRNALYPIDAHVNNDTGDVISYTSHLLLAGGFHGSKITYVITGAAAKAKSDPQPVEVAQTGVIDPPTNLFYFISVRCSPQCFTQYKTTIDDIVSSWTVKES